MTNLRELFDKMNKAHEAYETSGYDHALKDDHTKTLRAARTRTSNAFAKECVRLGTDPLSAAYELEP